MVNAWHRAPMLAFDLETSGPNPDTARPVTATLIELGREGIQRVSEWLINPRIPIPDGATAIHGITTERAVEDGRDAEEAAYEIHAQIGLWLGRGRPVVGFNLAYDFTVLDREARRHDFDTLDRRLGDGVTPVVDSHVIDKHLDRYRKGKRTLTVTAQHYGVRMEDAHASRGDALMAARVAYRLAETHPQLQVDLADLHASQTVWRAEQAASLAEHFAKQGKPEQVCGDWPVQRLPIGWRPDLVDPQPREDVA
jgi:DNA polymerase-3 subunit epsilon